MEGGNATGVRRSSMLGFYGERVCRRRSQTCSLWEAQQAQLLSYQCMLTFPIEPTINTLRSSNVATGNPHGWWLEAIHRHRMDLHLIHAKKKKKTTKIISWRYFFGISISIHLHPFKSVIYPPVNVYIAIENGPVEIVDFPITKWWFSIATLNYQRVSPPFSYGFPMIFP